MRRWSRASPRRAPALAAARSRAAATDLGQRQEGLRGPAAAPATRSPAADSKGTVGPEPRRGVPPLAPGRDQVHDVHGRRRAPDPEPEHQRPGRPADRQGRCRDAGRHRHRATTPATSPPTSPSPPPCPARTRAGSPRWASRRPRARPRRPTARWTSRWPTAGLAYKFADAQATAGQVTISSKNPQPTDHNIAIQGTGSTRRARRLRAAARPSSRSTSSPAPTRSTARSTATARPACRASSRSSSPAPRVRRSRARARRRIPIATAATSRTTLKASTSCGTALNTSKAG